MGKRWRHDRKTPKIKDIKAGISIFGANEKRSFQ